MRGMSDQSRLDQYLTSVREIERRLDVVRQWELRPKPTINQQPPRDIRDQKQFFEKFDLMLSMARLAFESDSIRCDSPLIDWYRSLSVVSRATTCLSAFSPRRRNGIPSALTWFDLPFLNSLRLHRPPVEGPISSALFPLILLPRLGEVSIEAGCHLYGYGSASM